MLREKLAHNPLIVQMPIGAEDKFEGVIDLVEMQAFYFDGDNGENIREEDDPGRRSSTRPRSTATSCSSALADFDDDVAEAFLEGKDVDVAAEHPKPVIRKATHRRSRPRRC